MSDYCPSRIGKFENNDYYFPLNDEEKEWLEANKKKLPRNLFFTYRKEPFFHHIAEEEELYCHSVFVEKLLAGENLYHLLQDILTPNELSIIELYFEDDKRRTQTEIGKILGISRSKVAYIYSQAKKKITNFLLSIDNNEELLGDEEND